MARSMSRFLARAAGQARLAALAVAGAMAASAAAADSTGVALVEQVTGSPPGVEFMDYVRAGQIIRLVLIRPLCWPMSARACAKQSPVPAW